MNINEKIWIEKGYADFADGQFGNGGQNLYVSRKGILQRIHHFDINKNGYADILFSNSQDITERMPVSVYRDIFGKRELAELPTQGAYAAAMDDLNGDGYTDLVVANQHNGVHLDVMAYIYYGSKEGLSERYKYELHAPNSIAVAIGDFNGNGLKDIAFSTNGKLRIFYQQAGGFRADKYVDIDVEITHMTAADLDGDGCDEIYARMKDGEPRVFWGGKAGIQKDCYTKVGGYDALVEANSGTTDYWKPFVQGWTPGIVKLHNDLHLFRVEQEQVYLYPIGHERVLKEPLIIPCKNVTAAASADLNNNGMDDLILTVCENINDETNSWIYWASESGFSQNKRMPLLTTNARNIAVGDLDGNGYCDILIVQGKTDVLNTTESLIYRNSKDGIDPEPERITTNDAVIGFIERTSDRALPDVVIINHAGGRVRGDVSAYIYYNGPDGFNENNRQELPGWSAPAAVCCDFDDDGWGDVLLCNCAEDAVHLDPGSFLYWNSQKGFDKDRKTVLPTNRAHGVAVGDFRHCGYLDLVIGGFTNCELLHFHGGKNGFDLENPHRILIDTSVKNYDSKDYINNPKVHDPALSEVRFLYTADFNNDGWLDIFVPLVTGPRSFIMWGGPDGYSMDRVTWLNVDGAVNAQAADLTGNGWLDLVIGSHNAKRSKAYEWDSDVYIYWGGPDGFSESRRTQLPAHTCNSLAIADFNNDGILDIFASSYNGGRDRDLDSYIYWGQPGGIYSVNHRKRLFTHSACGCIAADFNNDGWVDLAVASHKIYGNHTGHSQVWWNGPNGFSEERKQKLPTKGPHGMLGVNPGNVMNRGAEEYYVSNSHCLPEKSQITSIRWKADLPPNTWVKAQVRCAKSREMLEQAVWQGPKGGNDWFENGQIAENLTQEGYWVQYKLALGARSGSTPRIESVEVIYVTN